MIQTENNIKEDVIALKNGSYLAFEKLYKLYSGKLYNFMIRISSGDQYMAEEVVQSTFVNVWESRSNINPDKTFISYLCTIAKNMLMNIYQHQTIEFIYNEYITKNQSKFDFQTEDAANFHFLDEYIDKLTEALPPQRKKIFVLSKRENYSNKEIANMMNISESNVATQLSLAVNFLREQLLKHYDMFITILFMLIVNKI